MTKHATRLFQIINDARDILKKENVREMEMKPDPLKWSKKEILGHLIDSAYNNYLRFLMAEQQGNLIFNGYNQDDWVIKNKYQSREINQLIEIWYHLNSHIVELIRGIPESTILQKTIDHNFDQICMNRIQASEETNLDYLIEDYIFHIEHHLCQISSSYIRKGNE